MHELGIAQRALEIALNRAAEEGAERSLAMHIRIGALSGVAPDALRFALESIKADTVAASADVIVDVVPARATCAECGMSFEIVEYEYRCSRCGGLAGPITQGMEMDLAALEVA